MHRTSTAILLLIPILALPAVAQESDFRTARNNPAPEALRELPAQSAARAQLLPLHAASVMEWLCNDNNVRSRVGGTKASCYAQMRPGLGSCEAQMRQALPTGRSKVATTGRPDIVTFRLNFRECLQQDYIQRQVAAGKAANDLGSSPDPLAPRMEAR